nr:histidine kinase CKI1-like [Tanacetum cinerariifolium]
MGGEISIVDNKLVEKGTCFAFSVVLDVCLSNSRNIHEDDKTLSSGSNTPLRIPKRLDDNSSIVVIFICLDERRRVIQEFLHAHKIKVLAVKNIVVLSQTLRELKQEQEKVSSSKSDLYKSFGYLGWPTSRSSNTSPKNAPLSAMDGTDVSPTQKFGGTFPSTPQHHNQPTPREVEETQRITRDEQTPRKQEGPTEITKSSPLRGKNVLLADVDPSQRIVAQKLLSRNGVTTTYCVNNRKEALDMVIKGLNDQRNIGASHILPYDYIFMDCQMPDMDGCKATKQIGLVEKNYGVHFPIIGLTAHEEGEELNKMFAPGIDIYVSKPLDDQKALKVIEDLQYTQIRRMTEGSQ